MAESNAHVLSFIKETTRGETPTNPEFQLLPDNRTTVALQKDTLPTERMTGNRIAAKPRTGASTVTGDMPADLSFGAYDAMIASALQGTWEDTHIGQDAFGLISDALGPVDNLIVGDTASIAGGVLTVLSVKAQTGTVKVSFDDGVEVKNFTLKDGVERDIGTDSVKVVGFVDVVERATLISSNIRSSFSLLRNFSDLEADSEGVKKPFILTKGNEISSWNLSASANAIVKSTFSIFGQNQVGPMTDDPATGGYLDPIDTQPFDSFSGFLKLDGEQKCIVTEFNMTLNNNIAARYVVGCNGTKDPMVGLAALDGSINVYFETAELYQKFIDEEDFGLEIGFSDPEGNQMIVELPNLKILSGTQPDVTGEGQVTLPINFSAHKDNEIGSHIRVTRIAAGA